MSSGSSILRHYFIPPEQLPPIPRYAMVEDDIPVLLVLAVGKHANSVADLAATKRRK
jgi:hypothetical protein